MRFIGIIRILVILCTLLTTWYFAETFFNTKWEAKSLRTIFDKRSQETEPSSICNFSLMSSVKNNIGRGLNLAFVNASNGTLLKTGFFDMYSGEIKDLMAFIDPTPEGTLVFLASYDDPATK
ncbi:hypothetical protein FKM82_004338 [Ascaphus truei]